MEIIIRQENAAYSVVIKWRWHSSGPWGRERRRLEVNTYPQTHTYIVQREEKLLWWAAIHPLPQYWQELTLAHTHTTEQNASSLITSLCVNRLTHRLDSWVWFLALVTVKIEAFRIPIVTGQNYLDSSWACACIHACMSACMSARAIWCGRVAGLGHQHYPAGFHSLQQCRFWQQILILVLVFWRKCNF